MNNFFENFTEEFNKWTPWIIIGIIVILILMSNRINNIVEKNNLEY